MTTHQLDDIRPGENLRDDLIRNQGSPVCRRVWSLLYRGSAGDQGSMRWNVTSQVESVKYYIPDGRYDAL